jgi:hypothetical protein
LTFRHERECKSDNRGGEGEVRCREFDGGHWSDNRNRK